MSTERARLSAWQRAVSFFLKLVVILSAAVGTYLSTGAVRRAFMGGSRALMYFTIQSNILIAVICLVSGVLMLRKKPIPVAWQVVTFVGTVAITLTGVVYCIMLAPLLGNYAWRLNNVLTHVVVPAAAILDFFVMGEGGRIPRRSVLLVTLPPLAYAVYAGIGYLAKWEFSDGVYYPYFFLNWGSPAGAFGFTDELPYMGCVWWILLIFLFLIGIGWLYLALLDRINGRKQAE